MRKEEAEQKYVELLSEIVPDWKTNTSQESKPTSKQVNIYHFKKDGLQLFFLATI